MTDADLARFLAAETKSASVRIEDTGDRITAHPVGFEMPVGWFWFFVVLVFAGIAGAFVYQLIAGRLGCMDGLIFGLVMCMGPFVVWTTLTIMRAHFDQQTAPGPFFVLYRTARTLTLPRLGRTLAADDVLGFVQFHGWHTTRDNEDINSDWTAELSVLIPDGAGGVERLTVVTAMRTEQVDRLGRLLTAFFDRPRQVNRPGFWGAVRGLFTGSTGGHTAPSA
ncbi:MAG TPA: hypothetical protein VFG68_18605 [Fimbriiglobus sp.]|nr:hypothetical protein [Fimbriiglobus sp.]